VNGIVWVCVVAGGLILGQEPAGKEGRKAELANTFFTTGVIPQLRIEVSEPELAKLRSNNRAYVRCTIVENSQTTYPDMAIKLKGAAGSFRDWNDRPALTINSDKFSSGQSFHGLDKFHLNNSVQDDTYCQEWICESICRSAGLPATRVTHARVWLNGRDVGLYVLKEGFDRSFLKRHFKNADGNLYDGGFLQDIDANLEKDEGKDADDRTDLRALERACRIPDETQRFQAVAELLDVELFLTFVAFEAMACHWDGYAYNRNNYRIYFDPSDRKARFLPHGMDQMFGDTGSGVFRHPGSLVGSTVFQNRAWYTRYRERVREVLPHFSPEVLFPRLDALRERVQPVLTAIDPQRGREFDERLRGVKDRIKARHENLKQQIVHDDPLPPKFDKDGHLPLPEWFAVKETGDAVTEEVEIENRKAYLIRCGEGGRCVASWRRKIRLQRGKYELHARVKTDNVVSLNEDRGHGAGLRISGSQRENGVVGNESWKSIVYELSIDEPEREVVLVAELRSARGQAWFERDGFRLTKKP